MNPAQPPTTQLAPIPPAINGWNAEYLDAQLQRLHDDPGSLPPDIRAFLQGLDLGLARACGAADRPAGEHGGGDALRLARAGITLVDAYRRWGHLAARLDPFDRPRERPSVLDLGAHGLGEADLDRPIPFVGLPVPAGTTVRDLVAFLEHTYCGVVGAQIMHVQSDEERAWLIERCERNAGRIEFPPADRAHILEQLIRAEQFELYLGKWYRTEKRFSLEGGESVIPFLDRAIEAAAGLGVEEMVLGMAHRGRLNVLNNILGKTYEQIFTEFEDNWEAGFADGGGDVKYHRGYSAVRRLRNGRDIALAMASNPSHLESVDAVVCGRCRAKQRLAGDAERRRVVPLLIHGDAAVIGQGVVAEVFNFSQLQGYTTGGTIHVVVNNLIGFTTLPEDGRSSPYATDTALMIGVPVFHVNGEDPEAVVAIAQLAVEYRQRFRRDVVVDIYCFRRYGHNEADEASYTQPVMAELIRAKPSVLSEYSRRLLSEGAISDADMGAIRTRLEQTLDAARLSAKATPRVPNIDPGSKRWQGFGGAYSHAPVETGVARERLEEICAALGRVPEGFEPNPKIRRLLAERAAIPTSGAVNHADAELLAIGSLLLEGHGVRISGQDSRRGTFSQRHGVLRDYRTDAPYVPLNHMRQLAERPDDAGKPGPDGRPTQGRLCIYDSPLSEFAVMGFDYGYSLADPSMLVMWEAQFGDFVNGAQVMIDQYLAAAEIKWTRWSGLVLLLPHGYEGAGPEHSSARPERFLQLCADDNLQVVYPSVAAQMFHLLRRQVSPRRKFRKPLIVLTPKGMLREPTSRIDDLAGGRFHEILDDPAFEAGQLQRQGVSRVLLCTGKIYHELAARRAATGRTDTAIIRVEQLYPFHAQLMRDTLARYPRTASLSWVQEEPRNAGAYLFIADTLRTTLELDNLAYIGREPSATPAVGSKKAHKHEQEDVLAAAIGSMPAPDEARSTAPPADAPNGTPGGAPAPQPAGRAKGSVKV